MSKPETYEFDLVCIGSGPAGQRAAVQAAKLGKRVCIVERDHDVGGVCLHTGTIPSKTFREAVLQLSTGSNPFQHQDDDVRVRKVTGQDLFARVDAIVERETQVQEEQLRRNEIELISGTAVFQDPHVVIVKSGTGDRLVRANNILVAVSTRTTPPAELMVGDVAVITSDDIPRLVDLPRSMVVIRCGVVGIEYASMFATLGVEVTVVDSRRRPLEFLDELIHQMRDRRVIFRFSETVERLEILENGLRRVAVHLASGKRMASDLALLCAGRVGATDRLGLEKAGLSADSRGRLSVDANFRTESPHIFAAGDVIGFPSLAATSSEQGPGRLQGVRRVL